MAVSFYSDGWRETLKSNSVLLSHVGTDPFVSFLASLPPCDRDGSVHEPDVLFSGATVKRGTSWPQSGVALRCRQAGPSPPGKFLKKPLRPSAANDARHGTGTPGGPFHLPHGNEPVVHLGAVPRQAAAALRVAALLDLHVLSFRLGNDFVGKLASILAVTVTPQKDINIRLPVDGPCVCFFGSLSRPSWFFLEAVISKRTCAQG